LAVSKLEEDFNRHYSTAGFNSENVTENDNMVKNDFAGRKLKILL
jgi:hypothetical protein